MLKNVEARDYSEHGRRDASDARSVNASLGIAYTNACAIERIATACQIEATCEEDRNAWALVGALAASIRGEASKACAHGQGLGRR